MPSPGGAGRSAGRAVWVGLVLAAAAGGCEWGGGPPADDEGLPAPRLRLAPRAAPANADDHGVPPPVVPSPPVPQDPAAQARARATRDAWLYEDTVRAYEWHGRQNILWNEDAHRALAAWARLRALPDPRAELRPEQWRRWGDDQKTAWSNAQRALATGCDDPLIHYVFAYLSFDDCQTFSGEDARSYAAAVAGMRGSGYSAATRAFTFLRAGSFLARQGFGRTADQPRAEALIEEALALLPQAVRDGRTHPAAAENAYRLCVAVIDEGFARLVGRLPATKEEREEEKRAGRMVPGMRNGLARVAAVLGGDPANEALVRLLTGRVSDKLAWEGRGRAPATEVTTETWEQFEKRLDDAEQALHDALRLDPAAPDLPRLMIEVERGQGRGRARMEEWFTRALRRDGDSYAACMAKLIYLEPGWYGSDADMLAFGRACLATRNWEGQLPFILVEAHVRLAGSTSRTADEYFSRSYVWDDLRSVYEAYLAGHPGSDYDRSCFARFAALGRHYAEAHALFEGLGERVWRSAFGAGQQGTAEYLRLRAYARQAVNEAKSAPPPAANGGANPPAGRRPSTPP